MQKKWGIFNRFWHWLNAVIIVAMVVTSLFSETEIGPQIMNYHVWIGYGFVSFLFLRILYLILGFDSNNIKRVKKIIKYSLELLRTKRAHMSAREKYDFKKGGVKLSYLGFLVCALGIAFSGLALHFAVPLHLDEACHAMKEIHEFFYILILAFTALHLIGVVVAECSYEPNIVSDMINGGKEES